MTGGPGLQDLLVALLALAALAWLVRRRLRRRARPTPYCGECPGCAPAPDAAPAHRSAPSTSSGFVPLSRFGGRRG